MAQVHFSLTNLTNEKFFVFVPQKYITSKSGIYTIWKGRHPTAQARKESERPSFPQVAQQIDISESVKAKFCAMNHTHPLTEQNITLLAPNSKNANINALLYVTRIFLNNLTAYTAATR